MQRREQIRQRADDFDVAWLEGAGYALLEELSALSARTAMLEGHIKRAAEVLTNAGALYDDAGLLALADELDPIAPSKEGT